MPPQRGPRPLSRRVLWILTATLVVLSGLALTPPALALPDQRVAYGFDETGGTAVADVSGNGTNATATGTTQTAGGRYGRALVFNGSSSRVRSAANVSLAASFTFSAWVLNPSNQANETIVGVGQNRTLNLGSGVIRYYDGVTNATFAASVPTNTWTYVSLVSTGTTVAAYVNGVAAGSPLNAVTPAVSGQLQVGARITAASNTNYFSGTIDEVRLYNRALAAAELTTDMNAAINTPPADVTPPVVSGGQPTGTLPAGTTQTNLQVTTNEAATCRYTTTPGTAWAAMTNTFTTTGGTAHGSTITPLTDGTSYAYYVRCRDVATNANTADFPINFAVAAAGGGSTLGPWSSSANLPSGRSANGAVFANGYMYLVGGLDSSGAVVPTVNYAPVAANGSIGAWSTTTPFPGPVRSTRPVFYNGRIYVAGGSDGGNYYSAVYYAQVNPNGTLGAWTSTTPLPQAQLSHSTVAANGYLYIVAGNPGPCITTVRYAVINANGSLGAWNTTTPVPGIRCGIVEAATTYNGYLYLAAGYDDRDVTNVLYYTRLNADGTLGAWQTNANPVGTAREYHGVEAVNGTLYVIGGQAALFGSVTNSVERATINANGSVGPFSAASSLPGPRGYLATEAANGFVYAIGGGTDISGNSPQPSVYVAGANGSNPPPGDTTPPTVAVTAPAAGATVQGAAVPVTANAGDNVGVSGVQFMLDGNPLGAEDTTAPYGVTWNTATAPNGTHAITARARDAANNQTTSAPVSVTVTGSPPSGGPPPLLAYGLNEGSGTVVNDATTNNVTATATNPVWTASGRYGAAVGFNGSTRVRSNTNINLSGTFTLETWVNNTNNDPWETVICVGQQRNLYLASGVLTFYNGAGTFTFGGALPTGTWQHVALVSDGATIRVYVNGVQQGSTVNTTTGSAADPVQLGSWIFGTDNVDFFSGTLDEARVYNRALTPTEIQSDMATAIAPGP